MPGRRDGTAGCPGRGDGDGDGEMLGAAASQKAVSSARTDGDLFKQARLASPSGRCRGR